MQTQPTATQNDTTVTIPAGIDFATVRAVIADMQRENPENRERIGRALNVLLTSEIRATATAGVYEVQSCQDSATFYTASGVFCSCPDSQRHPGQQCKHAAAVQAYLSIRALWSWQRCQRWELTEAGAAALAALG